jgi:deoxyribose-phosphate aldolase
MWSRKFSKNRTGNFIPGVKKDKEMQDDPVARRIDETRASVLMELKKAGLSSFPASPLSCRARPGQPLGAYFDHTLLKTEARKAEFEKLCTEARESGAASVCLPPNRVALAAEALRGSGVKVCTVIGFPLGYADSRCKAEEVRRALLLGTEEFDTVVPVGVLKDRDVPALFLDIREVVQAAQGRLVKVILETCLLTEEEKILAGTTALLAGAHMLKTSTGFSRSGATVEDIRLLRLIAGDKNGVKASGGIRDLSFTLALIEAGADRIGASATVGILSEAGEKK